MSSFRRFTQSTSETPRAESIEGSGGAGLGGMQNTFSLPTKVSKKSARKLQPLQSKQDLYTQSQQPEQLFNSWQGGNEREENISSLSNSEFHHHLPYMNGKIVGKSKSMRESGIYRGNHTNYAEVENPPSNSARSLGSIRRRSLSEDSTASSHEESSATSGLSIPEISKSKSFKSGGVGGKIKALLGVSKKVRMCVHQMCLVCEAAIF